MSFSLSVLISLCLMIPILLTLGLLVGIRLYKNLKNEKHQEQGKVIQRIMKTYTVVQCVAWPALTICMGLLRINKVFIKFLTPSLERNVIRIFRSLCNLFRCYIGFNSLIIAICRYCFIVFDQTTRAFGIGKARKMLLCGSFGIPLCVAVLFEATAPMNQGWIALSTAEDSYQSPIFDLANSLLPNFVTDGIAFFCMSMLGIIFSNVGEGIIYLHIYIYGRR